VTTLPADGAPNVPETTNVVLRFSEPMNSASVEDAFFLASAPRTWTKLDGTFTWSQVQDEATYIPSTNLAFGTPYIIRVAASAKDVNGNPLDGDGDGVDGDDFASGFTIRAEPDALPPTVMGTVPADGAHDVARLPRLAITFDDAMNPEATSGAISMELRMDPFAGASVDLIAFEWAAANHTVSFLPSAALDWDSLYRVTVSQAAKDDAGHRLATPYSFSFVTVRWIGRVTGVVVAGETPVPDATVTLGDLTTRSNETGVFEFASVESGTYEITVSKEGYVTARQTRTLSQWGGTGEGGRTLDLGTISLQRSDLLSPTAVASILAGVLAALLTIGVLLRRRRRSVVRLDDLEPEEGEAER
jgi:hypothetical protein